MNALLLVTSIAITLATVSPVCAQPSPGPAPADRYFGQLHMSILGVRNSLADLSARVNAHPEDAAHVYDKALMVDDALHDWAEKFPHDPWLPKFAHALAGLYKQIDTEEARIRKNDTVDWLIATYPQSEFARLPRL
jgi:hypothetical protein